MSLVFAPLKYFTTTLQVWLDIFQPLRSLTIESPSMRITESFLLSGVSLLVLSLENVCFESSRINCVLFCSYFCVVESVLAFFFSVWLSLVSNGESRFLVCIGCITLDGFSFSKEVCWF